MKLTTWPYSLIISIVYRGWPPAAVQPEHALRQFELAMLVRLGYGVDFLHCTDSGQPVVDTMNYRYLAEQGFIASLVTDHHSFTGHELQALAARTFPDAQTLRAAKRFTCLALRPYLGDKPLQSQELFRQCVRKKPTDNA